ncbi:MAG TPA: L,D-transpeptidase family protein [Sphingomicrobium sp.]
MTLRTLSRGAIAALLLTAAPALLPTAAVAATPGAVAVPAAFNSQIYPQRGRFVLVDAASARLYMVEDGQVRDSMRVIVGKAGAQTPTIASQIYYATLNPYWNVPDDLARSIVAPNVLKYGVEYLKDRGYQVLDQFGDQANEIDPREVDWKAVAAGRAPIKVRQLPGPGNSMGEVKFGFPNAHGIFLHDTPKKELFASDQRGLSNGCVRLEDAPRLARWLLGRDASALDADVPEQHVALPRAMPIFITYLNEPANQVAAVPQMTMASASR